MKKNKWMRLASILLVLCLMTSCVIAGTFAKYISKDSASDTARVAKWGVNMVAGGTLFSDAYYANDNENHPDEPATWVQAAISALKITVATETDNPKDNIVAPGTKSAGDGMVFGLGGKPEVAFELNVILNAKDIGINKGTWAYVTPIELTADTLPRVLAQNDSYNDNKIKLELWVKGADKYEPVTSDMAFDSTLDYYLATVYEVEDGDAYFPVKYTCDATCVQANHNALMDIVKDFTTGIISVAGDGAVTITDTNFYTRSAEMKAKLPANTDLSALGFCSAADGTPATLTWEWKFSDSAAHDAADTILGHLIAFSKGELPSHDNIIFNGDSVSVTDGVVKANGEVVGNLITLFDISMSAVQID